MLIGELAKASGCSRDTIRFYEKIGLLEVPLRARRENNYKDYPDEALQTLRSITNLKSLGFTLEEVREIIIRRQMDALDARTACNFIEQKIIHLDVQIDKLLLYKHRLNQARMRMNSGTTFDIIPLTEMRRCA